MEKKQAKNLFSVSDFRLRLRQRKCRHRIQNLSVEDQKSKSILVHKKQNKAHAFRSAPTQFVLT